MVDIRLWREGEQTSFDVIKGDPKLVERRDIAYTVSARPSRGENPQMARSHETLDGFRHF
jgi:hypothetical protein